MRLAVFYKSTKPGDEVLIHSFSVVLFHLNPDAFELRLLVGGKG
jgi:hypothetical protein